MWTKEKNIKSFIWYHETFKDILNRIKIAKTTYTANNLGHIDLYDSYSFDVSHFPAC